MGNFATVFKSLRLENNLTQLEMADRLGISRSSIGMYENGEREPSFELLGKIADYFHVDMNYLLGKSEYSEIAQSEYYLDDATREMAQFLYENPDYKTLFDASRKVKKEDVEFVKQMIDRVNGGE